MIVLKHRVSYDEIDGQKVVFNAHYLKWCDRAAYEFFREGGWSPQSLEKEGFDFAVRKVSLDYMRPAVLDDVVCITTCVKRVGNSSFELEFTIIRDTSEVLSVAEITYVNVINGQSYSIPASIRSYLLNNQKESS